MLGEIHLSLTFHESHSQVLNYGVATTQEGTCSSTDLRNGRIKYCTAVSGCVCGTGESWGKGATKDRAHKGSILTLPIPLTDPGIGDAWSRCQELLQNREWDSEQPHTEG